MLLTVSVSPKLKELEKALILHHIWNVNDCMNFLVPEFLLTPRALPDSGIAPMSLVSPIGGFFTTASPGKLVYIQAWMNTG